MGHKVSTRANPRQEHIFVCAPLKSFVGDWGYESTREENIEYAKQCGEYVRRKGQEPFVPHLLAEILDDDNSADRVLGQAMALAALRLCGEVWVFGDYISPGMRREIEEAESCGIRTKRVSRNEIGRRPVDTPQPQVSVIDADTGSGTGCASSSVRSVEQLETAQTMTLGRNPSNTIWTYSYTPIDPAPITEAPWDYVPNTLTLSDYQWQAVKTTGQTDKLARVYNASLGLAGEVGEVMELIKKNFFHDKPLSLGDLEEECGDVLWYLSELLSAFGLRLDDAANNNLIKLQKRHPEGFDPKYHGP